MIVFEDNEQEHETISLTKFMHFLECLQLSLRPDLRPRQPLEAN